MVIIGHKPVFDFFSGLAVPPAVIHNAAGEFGTVAGFVEFSIIVVRENIFTLRTLKFERLFQINDPGIHAVLFDPFAAGRAAGTADVKGTGDFRLNDCIAVLCRSHFQQFFFRIRQLRGRGGKSGGQPQDQH